jgi:hypothetical protein
MNVLLSTRGGLDVTDDEIAGSKIAQRRAVLIDEVDRLSAETMELLGRLGRCAFVLAGVIEPREDDGPLAGEGTTIVRLAALPPDEVGAFVSARFVQVGLRSDLLTEAAIERLAALTGGVPRVLNMLTGSALFLARAAHAPRVDAAHVIEAAALRDGQRDPGPQSPAEASLPADPPPSDPHPSRALAVIASGKPLRAPAIMLTGASPSSSERSRRPSHVVSAGLLATAGLAAACAWFFLLPGQSPHQAVQRPKSVLVPAPLTPPPLPIVQPERAAGPGGTMIPLAARPPAAAAAAGVDVSVRDQNAKPAEVGVGASGPKPVVRRRSDQHRTWRDGPRPDASASRSGTLGLGERAPVEASHRNGGSPPGIGSVPPPPASAEHRVPKYVGIYTTGPDGTRTFRPSP